MFNFFKRKREPSAPDRPRKNTSPVATKLTPVDARPPRNENDVTTQKSDTKRKDVVNLLIPETDYNPKTGVGAILQIMAGKRRRRGRNTRAESCRVSPTETQVKLQRSQSELRADVTAPTAAENTPDANADADAEFVKALVLQKYAKPIAEHKQHVSVVYLSDEAQLDDNRRAQALLREIARSIDRTVDQINESKQMGGADSKVDRGKPAEPLYETIDERANPIDTFKNDVKGELEKLLKSEPDELENKVESRVKVDEESPSIAKKSNLKPPRSDAEGCSDDDRSDCGKKRVTFRKHIIFDDGEQQTDEEVDSSFESLSSEEEEFLEDIPGEHELEENKTVINVDDTNAVRIKIDTPDDCLKRISSDNSDSGFIECSDDVSEVKSIEVESEVSLSESETDEEVIEEIEEEIEEEITIEEESEEEQEPQPDEKSVSNQEDKFQSQVAVLTELSDNRSNETERARELISAYRKEIENKDHEIEQLKCELAAAYKESELVRQRSRSLEEELTAARSCSAELAEELQRRNDETLRQLRAELEDVLAHRAELESRLLALERDKDRLEQERLIQEQKAQEALVAAEANTTKWRSAHEAARSQAAARAELMIADCEWKMRELEKRARDTEKQNKELTEAVAHLKELPKPTPAHVAELQQLRGLATEQQRSVQNLTLQLQRVETREEALKLEVHRLKELLDRETKIVKENEEQHTQTVQRMEEQHSKALETLKSEHVTSAAATRAMLERANAERTRAALAQLRAEADQDVRNADRKLREITTRFENLKEVLASKESQFESSLAEARSKADWDVLQLRHLLDKADITYANNVDTLTERFEREKARLNEEWSEKLREVEEQAASAADEARQLLEATRSTLVAERIEQVNNLKEQHRLEMDDQWEQFMTDKENCLSRMKMECRQEGEEERVKREKELLEEIQELRAQMQSKSVDFDTLAVKAAACGRTLAVTEQELREALAREKDLREKRAEDATRIKQVEKGSKDQIEHLTRKCACLRKLFDDMRNRLTSKERAMEQDLRAKDKELHHLRGEVARLTKLLVEQSSPKLGARTRADGCETAVEDDGCPKNEARRKGGSLRTPEPYRKRPTLPELTPLPPQSRQPALEFQDGRRRAKSVDLPAVQVPVRIKQLEQKNKD